MCTCDVYTCVCAYVYIYISSFCACVCMFVYVYVYVHVCVYVCTYVYPRICSHSELTRVHDRDAIETHILACDIFSKGVTCNFDDELETCMFEFESCVLNLKPHI